MNLSLILHSISGPATTLQATDLVTTVKCQSQGPGHVSVSAGMVTTLLTTEVTVTGTTAVTRVTADTVDMVDVVSLTVSGRMTEMAGQTGTNISQH